MVYVNQKGIRSFFSFFAKVSDPCAYTYIVFFHCFYEMMEEIFLIVGFATNIRSKLSYYNELDQDRKKIFLFFFLPPTLFFLVRTDITRTVKLQFGGGFLKTLFGRF